MRWPHDNIFEPLETRQLMSTSGLNAQYFDDAKLQHAAASRTESHVSFDWQKASPASKVPVDGFTARWTGYVQAAKSETYKFSVLSDDGVRLWVDNQLIVNKWRVQSAKSWSGTIALEAGKYYAIKLEYFENTGYASCKLKWSSATTALQIIPPSKFATSVPQAPGTEPDPAPTPDPDPLPLPGPVSTPVPVYSAPITITRGGTYSGNWESNDPNRPAVIVDTTEPVVILNSNIRSRSTLIATWVDHADLTIQNTSGYALNPNVAGKTPGRFLDAEHYDAVTVQNCTMEGTSGIYLDTYAGDHSAHDTVKILNNRATNIDGRYSDGAGGYLTYNLRTNLRTGLTEQGYDDVQFAQLAKAQGLSGVEIAWNEVINEAGNSRVEDNISIYRSSGTAASPILIHDNYIDGAYTIAPWQGDANDDNYWYDWSYSGGGIMLGDGGSRDLSTACGFVKAYNNQVVGTTNYGIAVTAGHDMEIANNRVVSSGLLDDGRAIAAQNVGIAIWDSNGDGPSTFFNNVGHDNLVGWNNGSGRNDWWTPTASSWTNNTSMSGAITLATEANELVLWRAKRAA
jgi:hypothetical protein